MLFDSRGRIHATGVSSNIRNPASTAIERPDGSREHWHRGRLHREDGPAIEFSGKALELSFDFAHLAFEGPTELWFRRGRLHRDDGPAIRDSVGSTVWMTDGRVHREDGPAVEDIDEEGTNRWWFQEGTHHRDEGPAFSHEGRGTDWPTPDGDVLLLGNAEVWVHEGRVHRDGGPAVVDSAGTELWYWMGKLHREGGPAAFQPAATIEESVASEGWFRHGKPYQPDE